MRLGVAQTSPKFGDREENLRDAFSVMSAERADLWVLPEFFATGYKFVTREEVRFLAEPIPDGPTVEGLASFCRETGSFVVAGLPELSGDRLYNSSVLVGPEGHIATYRKVHLFGEEKRFFSPGDLPFPVIDIGVARVGLMICFDHLFPEAARTLALRGAEIIAHPANLIIPGLAQRTMVVRAIENGVFTATANRVGTETRGEGTLRYIGESQIVSPKGEVLVRLSPDRPEIGVVRIDPLAARDKSLTSHNDKLADRRPEMYAL